MTPYAFFLKHAGYSYTPHLETPIQGRRRCARRLADAECAARQAGLRFEWTESDIDSSDFSDESPPWRLFDCVAYFERVPVASLSGIDFGRDGSPSGEPYARVVEAELADEWLASTRRAMTHYAAAITGMNPKARDALCAAIKSRP